MIRPTLAAALAAFSLGTAAAEPAAPAPGSAAATVPRPAARHGGGRGVWINVGAHLSSFTDSEHNCPGYQAGLTFAHGVLLRVEYILGSYEDDDDGNTCDLGVFGDSTVTERSVLAGFALGRRGLFVAAGPSAMDVKRDDFGGPMNGPAGEDTGSRVELGWSAGLARQNSGLEFVLFRTDTEVRDVHGFALSAAFGLSH